MEFANVENGVIKALVSAQDKPKNGDWREVDSVVFAGIPGMDERLLDWGKKGERRPVEDLVKDGLLKDNRGEYWHKGSKKHLKLEHVGDILPDGFTEKKPPASVYAMWDEKNNKWIVDTTEEEKDRILGIRIRRRKEFKLFDKYQTVLASSLSDEQKGEFAAWRLSWLEAPATGNEPKRPGWFREY